MALGTPVTRGNAGGVTTATTAAFTAGAGDELRVLVFGRRNTQVSVKPAISDSVGLTWQEINDTSYDTGANPRLRGTVYRAISTGVSMTVTGTISDGTTTGIMVASISGCSSDISNQGSNTNPSGDPSVTLGSVAGTSGIMGMVFATATNLFTQGGGYTELTEFTANAAMQGEICYDMTSPGLTVSWTSTNTLAIGYAFELKEPSGGTPVNVALTGVETQSAVGTMVATGKAVVDLTGVDTTGSVGDLAPTGKASVALTGVATASAVGDLLVAGGAGVTVALTGVGTQSAVGNLTATGKANVSMIGVGTASAVGSLAVQTTPYVPPKRGGLGEMGFGLNLQL